MFVFLLSALQPGALAASARGQQGHGATQLQQHSSRMRGFSRLAHIQEVFGLPPDNAVTDLAPPNTEARAAPEDGGPGPVAAIAEPGDSPPVADAAVADVAAATAPGGDGGDEDVDEIVMPEPMAIEGPVPAPPPAPPTETSIDFSKYDNATTPLPSILWNETNKTEWESVMGAADPTPESTAMDAVQGKVLQEQLRAWLAAESDEAVRAKIEATLNISSNAVEAEVAATAAEDGSEAADDVDLSVNVTTEPPPEIEPLPAAPTPEPPEEIEMRLQAAVDCAVGDWSTFEDCKPARFDGARQWYTIRYRPVTNPQTYNGTHHGRPCPPLIERAPCHRSHRGSAATYR